ncbi:CBS domain-containing protein [Psychromarinibacter sp. C21-152]|uniref:CBS domain-containing protein n=1 Tax=Psychromarinibacter sediminicola TaxID=3033385 RepID=A0AAE3TBX8_9RHOB|nr:CBS domain-containing protein [Psychromarinibacter sediminicola]MDF0603384.1 CBS domain-containing protein [Psychromarinibacter sediminicola]
MRAKDIMTTAVVTVPADEDVETATALMLQHHVSGLPVTGADDRIVGVISEGDLMRRIRKDDGTRRSWWLDLLGGTEDTAHDYVKARSHKVSDVMTREVISVDEDRLVVEIARLLEKHRVKRVPVVRDGRVVGIVSRANLLHALSTVGEESLPTPSEDDRAIRQRVAAALKEVPGSSANQINITVESGDVSLWGIADSDAQKDAYRVAAENVPGVRRVDVHLGRLPGWAYGI